MKLSQIILAEFKEEAASTRKLLELGPFEKADYKPNEKSMSLKRFAVHIAEIGGWWKECLVMMNWISLKVILHQKNLSRQQK